MQPMMVHEQEKRPRGRPPKGDDVMAGRINIRIPESLASAIDNVRNKRRDGADTAQIVRELLVEALKAKGEI